MSVAILVRRCKPRNVYRSSVRQFASSEEPKPEESEDLEAMPEEVIEKLRNKSRLYPTHYRKFHKKPPSLTEDQEQVYSLSRLRRIYGHYGSASGINVGLLWPSKEELELQKEWERVAHPNDLIQMMEMAKKTQEEEEQKILQRQEQLALKVAKLEDWKQEVRDRVAKQEKIAREAKEKKERVMEEVRQMFGFRIDPKDERFKEALEKKEMEEKRAAKAAKKLKKQQKMIEDIKKMAEGSLKNEGNSGKELHGTSVVPGSQPPPIISKS